MSINNDNFEQRDDEGTLNEGRGFEAPYLADAPVFEPEAATLREHLSNRQQELDDTLEQLSEEIEMWQLMLYEASKDTSEEGTDKQVMITNEAIRSLDSKWPFSNSMIHIAGKWAVTKLSRGRSSIEFPMVEQDAFLTAQSDGFTVRNDEGVPYPTIGLSFTLGGLFFNNAALKTSMIPLGFAVPSEVSLTYVKAENDADVYNGEAEYFHAALQATDMILDSIYNDKDSEFYELPADKQQRLIYELIDRASDILPAPEFGTASCDNVTVPYVYRRMESEDGSGYFERITSDDDEHMMLSGHIEGTCVLEAVGLSKPWPLTSREDLVDPEAGICLIMRVSESTVPDAFDHKPIYVPVRQASELTISAP